MLRSRRGRWATTRSPRSRSGASWRAHLRSRHRATRPSNRPSRAWPRDRRAPAAGPATERAPAGRVAALTLGALGVVFGDIGTSPLYALQTVFSAHDHAVKPDEAGVYGVISLVFWAITIIVSVKYVTFIMRADNEGEGGIMALIALVQRAAAAGPRGEGDARRARHLRRGAVLRRRDDHAGDLGAVGGRGTRRWPRRSSSRSWCRSRSPC